jgi:hypothetical protein
MNEDIDALDRDMDAQREIARRAHEELTALRELRDEALDAHLATLTDERIMGDEQLLRRLLREGFHHSGASKLVHRLYSTGRRDVVAEGIDGRGEGDEDLQALPALQLRFKYRQATGPVAECMRAWAAVWALGRADLSVDILEQTLSRWASWRMVWDLVSDRCEVRSSSYGGADAEGTLEEMLRHVAEKLWYEGGPACDRDDYDRY